MVLSLDQLESIRMDAMACDVEIDQEKLRNYTEEQAMEYFESGGIAEPGLRLLVVGDGLAAGHTSTSSGPPDAPWGALLQQQLGAGARQVDCVGVPGMTTQIMADSMDGPRGLRTSLSAATDALGRTYDAVVLMVGAHDHMRLSGSAAATKVFRDGIVARLRQIQDAIRAAGARCLVAATLPSECREGMAQIISKTNRQIRRSLGADLFIDLPALLPSREDPLSSPDGIHLTREGYEELALRLAPLLRRFFETGELYQGEMRDGAPHGVGLYHYASGDVFDGEFAHGKWCGHGILQQASGAKYVGNFQDGAMHGRGVHRLPAGTVYEGDFAAGEREGEGVATMADGSRYEGGFRAGLFEGQGTLWHDDGAVYCGQFERGLKQGRGSYHYPTGEVDQSIFQQDMDCGEGVRWSGDRATAWRLYDGEVNKLVTLSEARQLAARVGIPVPSHVPTSGGGGQVPEHASFGSAVQTAIRA